MGRGLSEQQRRVLAVAYDHHRRREERRQRAQEARDFYRLAAAVLAARRGRQLAPPSPVRTPPDLLHTEALLALYGWCSGRSNRTWHERRRRIPSNTVTVYRTRRPREDTKVATIRRDEYTMAHASTARTIARLIARGLLERREPHRYVLTDAGLALCAELFDGGEPAGGEPSPPGEHANAIG